MLERAFSGSGRYRAWVLFLLALIGVGAVAYSVQLNRGLTVTGLSRDVSWGLYVGQLTFLVGVAASAVMVVLPYYFHDVKAFGRLVIFGEFLAVAAVIMCLLFVVVDLGKPMRLFNVLLHPTPHSVLFWDMVVLNGYLLLNLVSGYHLLEAELKAVAPPRWVKNLVYISVPWAVSIHTVTAFLYAGLPGRHYWLTALLAVRFLASAFAAGPAFLIGLTFVLRKFTRVDVGREAVQKLSVIMTYAMLISIFFVGLEFFTAFYSQVPTHMHALQYLFAGLEGHSKLVPLMWTCAVLGVGGAVLLVNPKTRAQESTLIFACVAVFVSLWIDKGLGLIVAGFVPNAFGRVTDYSPTGLEALVTMGVWAVGLLVLTVLCKLAVSVREEGL
ncbi:MAG TPA: NrfD/PsrC family molybdoenzyme membrane anchor subunit [Symbiobacteriaceae bacterium]